MEIQTCTKCGIEKPTSEYYFRKDRQQYYKNCKDCQASFTKARWPDFKAKCVDYKGGCCEQCGYSTYIGALDFHHLDPSKKDFAISKRVSMKWCKVTVELDKCAMLCANCHREAHAGLLDAFKTVEHGSLTQLEE